MAGSENKPETCCWFWEISGMLDWFAKPQSAKYSILVSDFEFHVHGAMLIENCYCLDTNITLKMF